MVLTVVEIPEEYEGVMGVLGVLLDKHIWVQLEIVGTRQYRLEGVCMGIAEAVTDCGRRKGEEGDEVRRWSRRHCGQ